MKRAIFLCSLVIGLSSAFGQVRHDLFIPVGTGDSLDATYYLPAGAPPATGYPAIVFVHGFGLSKDWDTSNCFYYSAAGYASFCFSVRGHGASSGRSTIMAGRERADFHEVLNFIRALPDIDTAHIGIAGGSQGGLHGLWAAADHLPVAAVSADVIVPSWASDLLMNGSIRRTFLLMVRTAGVRYDAIADSLWEFLRADAYDSIAARFPAGRDLAPADFSGTSIPLLLLLKWQDHYFSAGSGVDLFNAYGGTKKLYAGTNGHFSDVNDAERTLQSDLVTRWMNYHLKGTPNGITDEPRVTYAVSALPTDTSGYFSWTHTASMQWPPEGLESQPLRLYPGPDSLLGFVPPATRDSFIVDNLYRDSAYTFDVGYIEGFTGPNIDAALPRSAVSFVTPPLGNDLLLAGAPSMHLVVRSAYAAYPLHAQIYEIDSTGVRAFVTRINYTARHSETGVEIIVDATGIPHAHRFQRGNRIAVEFTNIDRTGRRLLGRFPFVLPMFRTASVTVMADPAVQSYIELPCVGTPSSAGGNGSGLPDVIDLKQNYPNPFNPSTVIRYSLLVTGEVTIKVYDLLGREVATLVNGGRTAGEHAVEWNASGVAAGIYYYRLTTATQSIVRKMLLVK